MVVQTPEGILEVRNATIRANRIEADSYKFDSTSNLEIGTANLFVDTTTSNVGIGTNLPLAALDVRGGITKTLYNPGEVIELLSDTCSSTSLYGRATMQHVTVKQFTLDTFSDMTGSVITGYIPPAGTKTIIYSYNPLHGLDNPRPIAFLRLMYQVDGGSWVEVTKARNNFEVENYAQMRINWSWSFKVGADSDDPTLGTFTATRPTLGFKWEWRRYDSRYGATIHATTYWEGATAGSEVTAEQFSMPMVSITAIA
jgi:hypothetical protein